MAKSGISKIMEDGYGIASYDDVADERDYLTRDGSTRFGNKEVMR